MISNMSHISIYTFLRSSQFYHMVIFSKINLQIVILFKIKNLPQKSEMLNAQPQYILFFTQACYLSEIITICFLLCSSRYLLILFSELASDRQKKDQQRGKDNEQIDEKTLIGVSQMKSIYHMLMVCLYTVYFLSAIALPLLLLTYFSLKIALLFSVILVSICGEFVPRIIVNSHHSPKCIGKWVWIITLAKIFNKIIPLNGLLKKIFSSQGSSQGYHSYNSYLTRENMHRLLGYSDAADLQHPIRQEQLQLLQKLRQLSIIEVNTLLIPIKYIFVLDIQADLSSRLLTHLGKYYFSKILVYSKSVDNIIGYVQFKQLLSFEVGQKISSQPDIICKNLVVVYTDSTLSTAIEMMINSKVNFAVVYEREKRNFIGLVKLKDIFSKLLLKWYNYGGLTADRTFHSINSLSLSKDKGVLEEGQQQS